MDRPLRNTKKKKPGTTSLRLDLLTHYLSRIRVPKQYISTVLTVRTYKYTCLINARRQIDRYAEKFLRAYLPIIDLRDGPVRDDFEHVGIANLLHNGSLHMCIV